jgi:hypothetical protein
MPCGDWLGRKLPGVPLVHRAQVLFIALEDEVRAFMLVEKPVVGQHAGKLQDAVGQGIQATHFQVYPQEVRHEIDTHHLNNYIKYRPAW